MITTREASPQEHDAAAAAAHFATVLRFQTDVSDVHADATAGGNGLVLVDSRSLPAWNAGHIPGALHMPTAEIRSRAAQEIPPGAQVVTYCWGPGCNGATRAALEFALLGYPVREMLGGYEYWVREGLQVEGPAGLTNKSPDPLTAPPAGLPCDC